MGMELDPLAEYGAEVAALRAQIAAATAAGRTALAATLTAELASRVDGLIADPTAAYDGVLDRILVRRWSTGGVYEMAPTVLRVDMANVRDYGVVGNGIADDTVALQAAITTGKTVDLNGLTIAISAKVNITTVGQRIQNGKVIALAAFAGAAATNALFYVTAADVIIFGVRFDCNGASGGAQDLSGFIANGVVAAAATHNGAIVGVGAHRLRVLSCYFTRAWRGNGAAVWLAGVGSNKNVTVHSSIFEYCYGGAVFTQSEGLQVHSCRLTKLNDAGIAFNAGGATIGSVIGCTVTDCELGGVAVESGAQGIQILGNSFVNSLANAGNCSVLITNFTLATALPQDVTISGNNFSTTYASTDPTFAISIRVSAGKNIAITGNYFYQASLSRAVYLNPETGDARDIVIASNESVGGYFLDIYHSTLLGVYENVLVHGNKHNATTAFFRAASLNTCAAETIGFIFDSNVLPQSGTEPWLLGSGGTGPKYTITRNVAPSWTTFGGVAPGAILNTFGYKVALQDGIWISTAAPTSGTWAIGDHVRKSNVAAAGTPGWSCTAAGTPGTWKTHANVAA